MKTIVKISLSLLLFIGTTKPLEKRPNITENKNKVVKITENESDNVDANKAYQLLGILISVFLLAAYNQPS